MAPLSRTVAVIGAPHAGTATTIGSILSKFGGLSMKSMESLQSAGITDYAGISRCPTVPKTFFTPSFFVEIVGEVDVARADCIVLVIAADTPARPVTTEVIAAALGYAKPLVVLVNKMDVVDWAEARLRTTVVALETQASKDKANGSNVIVIPIAAFQGDNLVEPSRKSTWFKGAKLGVSEADKTATTLLEALEAALAA